MRKDAVDLNRKCENLHKNWLQQIASGLLRGYLGKI